MTSDSKALTCGGQTVSSGCYHRQVQSTTRRHLLGPSRCSIVIAPVEEIIPSGFRCNAVVNGGCPPIFALSDVPKVVRKAHALNHSLILCGKFFISGSDLALKDRHILET